MAPAIVLHFHPGWKHGRGSVVDAIVADGAYRSQWLTGTSSGGLTAHLGGQRWGWEQRLFAGRYDHSDPAERPVYGAWNRRDDPYGAAPAQRSGDHDPQAVKWLWHCLARFGRHDDPIG